MGNLEPGKAMKKLFIISLYLCLTPQYTWAHIQFCYIEIISFKEKGNNEYILTFKPQKNFSSVNKLEKTKLHIRYNPKCVTDLIHSNDKDADKKKYTDAVNTMKDQISKSKTILFGAKSSTVFEKISGTKSEYQCENLSILKTGNEEIVYSIHADIGVGQCK